jgi:hypothetical protein
MKRLKLIMVLLFGGFMTAGLSSCNMSCSPLGSLTFTKVHIQMPGMSTPTHLEVVTWKEDTGGIELKTKNFGSILLGDGTYCLYDGEKCPVCHNTPVVF